MMSGVEVHRLALLASRTLIARVQLGDAPAALGQALSTLSSMIHASSYHGSLECGCSSSLGHDARPSTSSASQNASSLASFLIAQRPSSASSRSGSSGSWAATLASPSGWRQLHFGSAALQAADAPGGSSSGKEADGSAKSSEQPVANPLAAALASAAASGPGSGAAAGAGSPSAVGGLAQASQAAAGRSRRQPRNWMWYDEADEREERRKERQRFAWALGPGGEEEVGSAHLMDVPQGMKKMQRIIKLVRGLPYADAVAQCTLVPHKAARYMLQALEAAHEDATQVKGLDPERLVVGTVFVTRGRNERGISFHAKGRPGSNTFHRSHLRVVLNQTAERPAPFARVVAPLMSRSGGSGALMLGRGGAGAGAGGGGAPRPRFAYRTEV